MDTKLTALRAKVASVLLLICACGGTRSEFIGARVLDSCNESWPVCDSFAGCLLGTESYVEGRFPNQGKVLVQLAEPSTIRVSFYLENISASGLQTSITFYESRCRARTRQEVSGEAFIAEAEGASNLFFREADLVDVGDHLIEFDSDAQAEYTMKIDVTPKRL